MKRKFKQSLLVGISAINILDDTEEPAILSYASVLRASASYWTTNGDKWVDNINGLSKPSYWGKVGKADGKGAAAGAGAWGIGALLGGPVTWTAFGVSVGGWAVGCSIYEMF
jgi:hypothetical protein